MRIRTESAGYVMQIRGSRLVVSRPSLPRGPSRVLGSQRHYRAEPWAAGLRASFSRSIGAWEKKSPATGLLSPTRRLVCGVANFPSGWSWSALSLYGKTPVPNTVLSWNFQVSYRQMTLDPIMGFGIRIRIFSRHSYRVMRF